ncbi:MAG TPA: hypothetical protein VGS18_01345 [Thermoplasmata archaeon]|nr:hypothetical protein [Thermoplasmata archaeon]
MPVDAEPWGTCTYCGDAFPPKGRACPTCGNSTASFGASGASVPHRERFRFRLVRGFRGLLIVGVVVGLAYLMLGAALTPPAPVTDPLTTKGTWTIDPGRYTALSGAVTGADYVIGNFTVTNPPGAPVTMLVFNDSEFARFASDGSATPSYNLSGASAAHLTFSAPYTDTYHFVFENRYAPSTGLVLEVYVVTNYESNALVE